MCLHKQAVLAAITIQRISVLAILLGRIKGKIRLRNQVFCFVAVVWEQGNAECSSMWTEVVRGKRTKERTERIEIRCAPIERQGCEAQAAARGCSLSSLIRAALGKPYTKHDADPALLRQLAAMGNNLNQLTRWANIHKEGIATRLVLAELQHIRRDTPCSQAEGNDS